MSQNKLAIIISYFTLIFYIVTGLLYTPFLIDALGMSDYGLYTLSASVVAYFTIDFGLGAAQSRYIAKYLAQGLVNKVKGLLGVTIKLYLIVDVFILLMLFMIYIFSDQIFVNLTTEELERFKVIFLISGSFVMFNFPLLPVNGIFVAYEKILALKLFDLASKIITLSLLVGALLLDFGLFGVVFINAFSVFIVQISKLLYLYRKVHLRVDIRHKDNELLKSIASFSMWATLAVIGDKFFFAIIPSLLAIFSNTQQIAFFAIVVSIEGYVLSASTVFNGIFLPRVIRLAIDNNSTNEITDLMIRVGRIQLYIVGLFVVGLISFGKEFFYHWLGDGFDTSYYAMVIVLFPCLFHLTQSIAEEFVYAKNKVKYRAFVYLFGALINLIAIALLSPKYGAIGAAIGVSLTFIIAHNIVIDIIYHKYMKIDMIRFFRECHLKISPSLLLAGIVGYVIQLYFPTESFFLFVLKGFAWMVIYFILNWIISFNKEEKNMIKKILKKH